MRTYQHASMTKWQDARGERALARLAVPRHHCKYQGRALQLQAPTRLTHPPDHPLSCSLPLPPSRRGRRRRYPTARTVPPPHTLPHRRRPAAPVAAPPRTPHAPRPRPPQAPAARPQSGTERHPDAPIAPRHAPPRRAPGPWPRARGSAPAPPSVPPASRRVLGLLPQLPRDVAACGRRRRAVASTRASTAATTPGSRGRRAPAGQPQRP